MRILLTGATGFIGSHLLEKMVQQEIPVAIILRESSDTSRIKHLLKSVTVIKGDLSDIASIESQIVAFQPEVLVHLAWYGVENRFRNEYQQLSLNLLHVSNLLQIIEKTPIKKIIGFGSQGEYGPHAETLDENYHPKPTTLYGVSKLCAYQIMQVFCQQKNIDLAWIRLFSIYGPKDNTSWLIPSVIKDLLAKNSPPLTEGKQFWDFLYVSDAVQAIMGVIESPNATGIFNLGSGASVTIRKVVETIRHFIDPAIELGFGQVPYRPDQVMFLEADTRKLKTTVGWHPKVSLEEGLQHTIAWYQQQ